MFKYMLGYVSPYYNTDFVKEIADRRDKYPRKLFKSCRKRFCGICLFPLTRDTVPCRLFKDLFVQKPRWGQIFTLKHLDVSRIRGCQPCAKIHNLFLSFRSNGESEEETIYLWWDLKDRCLKGLNFCDFTLHYATGEARKL